MFFHFKNFKILAILIAFSAIVCSANQPAYQVSLYVRLHPRAPPVHLCNGVIVQSRLILTTASCVHYKFSSSNSPVVAIDSGMLSVISGSSTRFHEELTLQVANIFVAENFNFTTGENDLAILRLNGILPLDTRNDMSWITLEDDEDYDGPCLANFYVRNSINGAPNYIQSEQLPLLDTEACRATSENLIERENDLCSLYYLPTGFNCNAVETLQNYNGDRGTGLVCGNKLIGILSTILPWQNNTDCIEKPIRAYYSAIVPHIGWIFDIITDEDLNMLNEDEYISSSAYAGKTNAFVEPQVTELESTPVFTTADSNQSTYYVAEHNGTALSVTNSKFLFWLLGVVYFFILQAFN